MEFIARWLPLALVPSLVLLPACVPVHVISC